MISAADSGAGPGAINSSFSIGDLETSAGGPFPPQGKGGFPAHASGCFLCLDAWTRGMDRVLRPGAVWDERDGGPRVRWALGEESKFTKGQGRGRGTERIEG